MTRRACVTGAAGFIGRHVVRDLMAHGWHVHGLDVAKRPDDLDCNWMQGSILDEAALTQAMVDCDTVFHLAAHAHLSAPDPAIYQRVNVDGTAQVLAAATMAHVSHLIATSSAVIFQTPEQTGTIDENTPPPARSDLAGPYARSKWDADQMLEAHTGPLRITRLYPTVPIGPGDWGMTAPTQMLQMFLTSPPPAVIPTDFNFVPVEDVARAHRLAAQSASRPDRFLLPGDLWSMARLLTYLRQRTGREMPERTVPYWLANTAAQVGEWVAHRRGKPALSSREGVALARCAASFSGQRAQDVLGWAPGPTQAALNAAIEWLQTSQPS